MGAEYLENSDLFTLFFGQDECFSLDQGEQKNLECIDNVLVEKFTDYGVSRATEIDTNFEGIIRLFSTNRKSQLASSLRELSSNHNI